MSESGDAEVGGERPGLLVSMGSAAGRVRSVRFSGDFRYVCIVTSIWTIVLLGLIAIKWSVAPTIVTVLGEIVSAIATIIGIFRLPRVKIDPKIIRLVVVVILVADVVGSVAWPLASYHLRNRDIDVLSTIALSRHIGVLPGRHAALDATTTESRDTIELVFKVEDSNPHIGSCLPSTELSVTPNPEGNPGETVFARPGDPVSVDLPAGAGKLHLDIVVTNTRGDQNCAVNLSVESAKLRNK